MASIIYVYTCHTVKYAIPSTLVRKGRLVVLICGIYQKKNYERTLIWVGLRSLNLPSPLILNKKINERGIGWVWLRLMLILCKVSKCQMSSIGYEKGQNVLRVRTSCRSYKQGGGQEGVSGCQYICRNTKLVIFDLKH